MTSSHPKSRSAVNLPPVTKESHKHSRKVVLWGSLVWVFLFVTFFFQFDLPNSSPKINRTEILQQLPMLLMDTLDPPPPRPSRSSDPREQLLSQQQLELYQQSGWSYFPQRLPYLFYGSLIGCAGWACGRIVFRLFSWPREITRAEYNYLAILSGYALITLLMLLGGLAGLLQRPLWVALLSSLILVESFLSRSRIPLVLNSIREGLWQHVWKFLPLLPFLICFGLGALLPEIDFDVKEYHLGGPKEWYLAGKIFFLPHNVYTSFPFLTEMFLLLGMIVTGDWYWGVLSGKFVLMSFAPLTAWGIFLATRRWFGPAAAWGASFLYLTTPWVYRLSVIAYAEGGLTAYLFASLFGLLLAASLRTQGTPLNDLRSLIAVIGFLAGSAMACKYPGLVSVVVPMGLSLVWLWKTPVASNAQTPAPSIRTLFSMTLDFCVGVFIAIGPWLIKNYVQTGNPVYPLGYTIFGGTDWNPELNQKWRNGHSSKPSDFTIGWLATNLIDVTLKSDWQSPLLFSLAPLVLLIVGQRRVAIFLWGMVLWQFLTWWGLTHRIDRFWVPLIPVVTMLAGAGLTWSKHLAWKSSMILLLVGVSTFHFVFITSRLCGYNAYLLDLQRARSSTLQISSPEIEYLQKYLPKNSKVLFVGEAELFDADFPYEYNTVFDFCLFEQWTALPTPGKTAAEFEFRPTAEIRQTFKDRGITHICVNWQEILRYRNTYGYTDFVTRDRFLKLQQLGILEQPLPESGLQLFDQLSPADQKQVLAWSPQLLFKQSAETLMRTFEVFPVKPD